MGIKKREWVLSFICAFLLHIAYNVAFLRVTMRNETQMYLFENAFYLYLTIAMVVLIGFKFAKSMKHITILTMIFVHGWKIIETGNMYRWHYAFSRYFLLRPEDNEYAMYMPRITDLLATLAIIQMASLYLGRKRPEDKPGAAGAKASAA